MLSLLVTALLAAAPAADTVHTTDGRQIAGTVVEDSPSAGVTIQMPDGSVRRIAPGEVSRIEYADGSVSTPPPRPEAAPPPQPAPAPAPQAETPPPQPAPAPQLQATPPPQPAPAPAPPPPTRAGPPDTVRLVAGGRVRGGVVEESAATGVKIRRLDGTIQVYPLEEIVRIEYADGTVSIPRASPASTPAPAPPARATAADGPLDTVYFLGGGRVRGTVIEEHPKTGVTIRLLDGTYRTYPRNDLVRIEYSDGTVSRRKPPPQTPRSPP